MTNLIQTMKSRHNNTRKQHTTTGFARRALLLFTFFVACMGNVWGQEEQELWNGSGYFEIEGSEFESQFGTSTEIILRIYCDLTSGSVTFQTFWGNQPFDKATYTSNDAIYDAVGHFLEFNLNSEIISMLIAQSLKGWVNNDGSTLTQVTWYIPAPDTFEDPNKSPNNIGTDITKYLTTQTQLPIDVKKATALLDNEATLKYVRFYVLQNGEKVDLSKNTGLLEITDVTPAAQLPTKGIYGYYLYNSGNELDLDNIRVNLYAEAGKFPEYQVICVLSTQEARVATGNDVTEEPYWDVVFTYAFRNQVETKNQTGTVEWDAVAMTATIPTDDMAEKWGTSWSNLAQEQKIQWYVTDGADGKQPLVVGTERQADTWTINLSDPFVVKDDVAVLTGQTTYDATSFEAMWNIWGNPAVYAPANKGYADVKDYKIVCEIADDPESTKPNVIYTLSIEKTPFAGQEKTTIVKTTQQVKLDANAISASIPLNLPEGTKYVRFYVVDQNGTNVNEPWINEGTTIYDKEVTGKYMYGEQGLTLNSITIGSNSANLNEYQVIMVTSTETTIKENGSIKYEPDYDTQTTFWFKYPVEEKWNPNETVEWSPQSMQIVAPNIEGEEDGQKGTGYLEKNRQHYALEWTVVDKNGNTQPLCIGDSRVDDYWSFNIVANPFTLADDGKSLVSSNDPNLNVITWNSWAAPQIFAPKNMTMKQIAYAGIKFICKFYEDDEAGDDNMLAMTYTVEIVRTEQLGQLKYGGLTGGEIIEDIDHTETESLPISLENAANAFKEIGKPVTYARIYLTRNDGTALHPGEDKDEYEQLEVPGGKMFDTPEYGYFFQNEAGIDLSTITTTLKLPAGTFTYYNVVIAVSTDTDNTDFPTNSFYESDYDYIYTIKFVETSSFPGTLVESLITHTKEVHLKAGDMDVLIPLNETNTVSEFLSDLNETRNFGGMASDYFHVRWFVAKKNADGTYEKLAGSENMLDVVTKDKGHLTRRNQGVYWNYQLAKNNLYYFTQDDILKVNFTKPTDGNWSDYQVVVWLTNSSDGEIVTNGTLSHEPDIKVQYIFSFYEEDWKDQPFVHYQGEAYRYLKEKGEDIAAQQRDYITLDGDAWAQEYTWNTTTNSYELTSGNIRQGVHTWEYDVYILPDEERKLILPFQYYEDGRGNDNEPRAYIRWYNWNTDTKVVNNESFTFAKGIDSENKLIETDRGLFALYLQDQPTHKRIGVTFKPTDTFNESIDIACDVSKYSDGIITTGEGDNAKSYLIHEPTLSTRYIFHIHPASESADSLTAAKQRLEDAEAAYKNGGKARDLYNVMSTLKEDKGKVVVSLGEEMAGKFALRFDHHNLLSYVLEDDNNGYVSATGVQWYAYFENSEGIWRKNLIGYTISDRITSFKFSDHFKGDYYFIGAGDKSEPLKITDEKSFHVVGYVGYNTFDVAKGTGTYAPIVHYELHFIEAPPIPATNLVGSNVSSKYLERTEAYMNFHYDLGGVVDFDGNPETNPNVEGHEMQYYSTERWDAKPNSSAENMTYEPFPWDDVQYGFCFPQLVSTIRNGYKEAHHYASPEHGDYIIIKSMNESGISTSNNSKDTAPFEFQWWHTGNVLYDYTHTITDQAKYGSFLYTDASDESRIIATIPFSASLCDGSSIYFTGAVADMTKESVKPQLLIRIVGIKADGTRERIVAFHTGDINELGAGPGAWYQVYGVSTVPTNFDENITNFEAEVINYASGTLGADFAIDQLVIYTSTAKVLLTQTGDASCKAIEDENSPSIDRVKVYMEADGLQSAFGVSDDPQPIYWRICDEKTGEVVKGPYMYPQYNVAGEMVSDDHEGKNTYGVTYMVSNYLGLSDGDIKKSPDTPELYGWYYDKEDDKYYFQIANKSFEALEEGKDYYVSVYDPNADIEANDDAFWGGLYFGAKSRCSIYSEFFVPRRQYVTYTYGQNGEEGGDLMIDCGSTGATIKGVQMILKVPDKNEPTGFKNYTEFHYDFAFVPLATWKSEDATFSYDGNTYKYAELRIALDDYRGVNSSYRWQKGLDPAYENVNKDYYDLLNSAVNAGVLRLYCSEQLEHEFTAVGDYAVTCIPIEKYVNEDVPEEDRIEICAPFEVTFKLRSSGGPELDLGFSDVTYPTTPTKYLRVVRVGLKQIKAMQRPDGYLLHIPVHSFKTNNDAVSNDGALQIEGDMELLASSTGDDQTNDADWNANVAVAGFDGREISKSKMYVSVNFHDDAITQPKQTFKEGFTYRMFFRVKDGNAGDGACDAGVEFLMKVVPEYVTWNDKGTTVTPNSNKTDNWNNDENWSRSKHDELYSDTYVDNTGDTPAAFVPMKFTYVTIPSDNVAPNLIGLTRGTDDDIYNNIGDGATPNIQYDLMVMVDEENKCTHGGGVDVYDCEKFYGNWAKEIYFKPRAELVHQQYLTYGKAWVEKELVANKWYLMSTPLKETYAGDMYVPYESGRQETEAFEAINFTDKVDDKNIYSRTKYPIYQRSWGTEFASTVYTQTTDTHRSDYSANLGYTTWSGNIAEWGHTFNDVAVPYTTRSGFSIRAHKKDQTEKALLRLPKDDLSYSYYGYDVNAEDYTEQSDAESSFKKEATDIGKFLTVPDDADITLNLKDAQQMGGYVLVGNPYMASLNMAEFFSANADALEAGYYTYEASEAQPHADEGFVRPLQAFFVKAKSGGAPQIKFTSDMMMDGNNPPAAPSRAFTLTAANDRGRSTANVSVGEEAKSVETLFDSNLADVPMVYTVADGQAVSVNQVTETGRPIAFGVTCGGSEPVAVTFSDIELLTAGELYVLDAVTGEQTAVDEGSTLSIQPNDYGRYFLLTRALGSDEQVDVQKGIVISVRGREVTVTSGEALTLVRALSPDGTTVHQEAGGGTTASFVLASGVYVVKAENAAGEQQAVKIVVK